MPSRDVNGQQFLKLYSTSQGTPVFDVIILDIVNSKGNFNTFTINQKLGDDFNE